MWVFGKSETTQGELSGSEGHSSLRTISAYKRLHRSALFSDSGGNL